MLTYEMRPDGILKNGLIDFCNSAKEILGDNITIVEIGSYCGSGTMIIHSIFPNSKILCVDGWEKYIESCSTYDIEKQGIELKEAETIFDERTFGISNIVKNKILSLDFAQTIENNSIDLVYIDGNHDYVFVRDDIMHWMPKIKSGGIIGGHDWNWPSVQKAISEIFSKDPYKTFDDGSWFFVKE